jgi:Putative DNA-binding domain
MATPSQAHHLYERIVNAVDPVSEIRKFYAKGTEQEETDWLEFKTLPDQNVDAKLKSLWAESLCGFSNNTGGVLVWGIAARKNANDVDAACGEMLVKNPKAVKSRLIELQGDSVTPPPTNVLIHVVEAATGDGFVICFVPEGQFKPYRAEDKRQYVIRAGDRFVVMSTAMLRSMFFPKSQAAFKIWAIATISRRHSMEIEFQIANAGNATATDMYVAIRPVKGAHKLGKYHLKPGSRWSLVPGKYDIQGFESLKPLHPGSSDCFGAIIWSGEPEGSGLPEYAFLESPSILLAFTVYCANQEPQSFSAMISGVKAFHVGSLDIEFSRVLDSGS